MGIVTHDGRVVLVNNAPVQTDTTLSVSGMAADSKTVGNKLDDINDKLDDVNDELDSLIGSENCLVVTPNINVTTAGVTRTEVNRKLRLTGTAEGNRRFVVFNGKDSTKITSSDFEEILAPGRYKVNISSSGKISTINSLDVTYTSYATDFMIYDGTIVEFDKPVMVAFLIRSGVNYGGEGEYTDIDINIVKIGPVSGMVNESNPYFEHVIKQPGEYTFKGYSHQAFPDIDYFQGNTVIVSRVSTAHYTPSNSSNWGGLEIDTVSSSGVQRYQSTLTASNFSGLNGEIREGYIHPVLNGLLLAGWTTYDTLNHDSFLAFLSKSFNVINYIVNPVTDISFTGKPLITPNGNIIACGYRSNNVYIVRSNESFNGDVSSLTYSKIIVQQNLGNECCLGYNRNKLYLIIRNKDASLPGYLYVTSNLEGTDGWELLSDSIEDSNNNVSSRHGIHSPRLLPYSNDRFLVVAGANYRSSNKRNSVIGYIDLDSSDLTLNTGIISDNLNYGGYTGVVQYNKNEYDVVYYREGTATEDASTAIESALFFKRLNIKMLIDKFNSSIINNSTSELGKTTSEGICMTELKNKLQTNFTPLKTITDGSVTLDSNAYYTGVPYFQTQAYGRDALYAYSLSAVFSAFNNIDSLAYDNVSDPWTGAVCSSVVSWATSQPIQYTVDDIAKLLNYKTLKDLAAVEIGDVLIADSSWPDCVSEHVLVVSNILSSDKGIEGIEITEGWKPVSRKILFKPDEFWGLFNGETRQGDHYRIGRFTNTKMRSIPPLIINNDIISEKGDDTYFELGEDIFVKSSQNSFNVLSPSGVLSTINFSTLPVKNTTQMRNMKSVLNEIGRWTLYGSNNEESHLTIIKKGNAVLDNNVITLSGYEGCVPYAFQLIRIGENITSGKFDLHTDDPLWNVLQVDASDCKAQRAVVFSKEDPRFSGVIPIDAFNEKTCKFTISTEGLNNLDAAFYIRIFYDTGCGQAFKDTNLQERSSNTTEIDTYESVATFERMTDGMPVNSLVVDINHIQLGEGDPSLDNVRPLRGWVGTNITRVQKNLCPPLTVGYTYALETGVKTTASNAAITPLIRADFTLGYLSFSHDVNLRSMLFAWDDNGTFIGRTTGGPAKNRILEPTSFSSGEGTKDYSAISFVAVRFYEGSDSTDIIDVVATAHIQLELGADVTTYKPYKGEVKSISWQSDAGTVYDGSIDITTGLLTVTHKVLVLDGATEGHMITNQGGSAPLNFYLALPDGDPIRTTSGWLTTSELEQAGIICSVFTTQQFASELTLPCVSAYCGSAIVLQPRIGLGEDNSFGVDSVESCNTWLAGLYANGTPVTIRYKLKTSEQYQLTPTEVTTIFGKNNVWADLIDENNALSNTGEVAVTFGADIKKYVDESVGDIPKDYYKAEIEQTIQDVQAANTAPGLVFLLCTDIHYLSKNGDFPEKLVKKDSVTDMCVNMKNVLKEVKADGLVCLGDLIDGAWISEYTTEETIAQSRYVMSRLHGIGLPLLYALGNHDDNRYIVGEYFTPEELYARNMSFCPTERVSDVVMNGLNYYMDYPSQKIRCISVDSSYFNGGNWVYGWDDNTLDWFTDQLAAIPEGWGVIVFSHLGFVQNNNVGKTLYNNQQNMIDAIDAFIDGGGNYIATIYGHSHVDYSNSTPWLEITLGCAKPLNGTIGSTHPSGSTKPTRTRGTATEDLWDILIIQPNSRTIKTVRFGAGENREWSY